MAEVRPHLRAWRLHLGWSQARLANELGTDHTLVGRYEKGTTRVEDATFARIAEAYGITVAELSAPPDDAPRARQMHRILTSLRDMDEGTLMALADMAERLPKR